MRNTTSLASVEEERSALGAALLDATQAEELIANAHLDCFTYSAHRLVFAAMIAVRPPFDHAAIAGELQRQGNFDHVGWNFLTDLDLGVVTARPMARRIERLRELRRLRALARLGEDLSLQPYAVGAVAQELIRSVHVRLEEIAR